MDKKEVVLVVVVVMITVLLSLMSGYVVYVTSKYPSESQYEVEDLSIAVDSRDNLHVVWADNRDTWRDTSSDDMNVYYAVHDSNRDEMTKDRRLTQGRGCMPSIGIDSKDNILVTYRAGGSFLLKLTPEGEEVFRKKVHNRSLGRRNPVAITMGSDDNIYLSWDEGDWIFGFFRYYMMLDSDGNVRREVTNASLETSVPGFPIVTDDDGDFIYMGEEGVTDSQNTIHVVDACPSSGYDLCYSKISNGEILTNRSQITELGGWSKHPRVAVDSFDNIHIVDENNDGIGYLKLDNTGEVLRIIYNIEEWVSEEMQFSPDVDADSEGNAYIVWWVMEPIREVPHSGLYVYRHVGYCAKVDPSGHLVGGLSVIAKSYELGIWDFIPIVTAVLAILILVVVGALTYRRGEGKVFTTKLEEKQ
jgi:hypothetical protein